MPSPFYIPNLNANKPQKYSLWLAPGPRLCVHDPRPVVSLHALSIDAWPQTASILPTLRARSRGKHAAGALEYIFATWRVVPRAEGVVVRRRLDVWARRECRQSGGIDTRGTDRGNLRWRTQVRMQRESCCRWSGSIGSICESCRRWSEAD